MELKALLASEKFIFNTFKLTSNYLLQFHLCSQKSKQVTLQKKNEVR